jgi:hypothetical protein
MRDLKNNLGFTLLRTIHDEAGADHKSDLLDLAGHEGCVLMVVCGALTGVDGTHFVTHTVQESDTTADGDFTAVAAGDLIGAFTKIDAAAEDDVIQRVGYVGGKRYVRIVATYTNPALGLSAGNLAYIGVVGISDRKPVTAPAAVTAT